MSKMVKILAVGVVAAIILGVVITLVSVHGASTAGSDAITSLPCCHAVSVMNMGPAGSTVSGVIEFHELAESNVVTITGEIHGLPPNSNHGFHIHESGDLRNPTNPCLSTGAHFNPFMYDHGAPHDTKRHIGDLGNVKADGNGVAKIDITDSVLSLNGPFSIIGRAVVVHEKEDDLGRDGGDSKNTGNAGARVSCGVIGVIYKKP